MHHQYVNAIFECSGKVNFARGKNAVHVNCRKHFVPYHKTEQKTTACGVVSIESFGDIADEVLEAKKLRYATPNVEGLRPEHFLTGEEGRVLAEYMSYDDPQFGMYCGAMFMGLEEDNT